MELTTIVAHAYAIVLSPNAIVPRLTNKNSIKPNAGKHWKFPGRLMLFSGRKKGRTADAITDDATTTSAFVWIDVIFTTKVGADRFVTHSTASHVVIIAQYEWWLQRDVVDNGPFFALHNRVKYDRSIAGPRLPILWSKNREQKSQKRAHDAYPPTTTTFYYFFFCVSCRQTSKNRWLLRQFDVDNNNDDRWPSAKSIDFIYFTREMCRFLS